MLLFRRRYPRWWFDFAREFTRFGARVGAYLALLTDRYPSTVDEQSVHLEIDYPDAEHDLNRWLPLVKWFLAIPHYIVLALLAIGALFAIVIAWFAILFTGRYPRGLFDYVVGVGRWALRVAGLHEPAGHRPVSAVQPPVNECAVAAEAFAELERGVHAALETYSNVHRGSGHNSMVSTHLFEQARDIVLEYLGLNKDKYVVIFCTPRRAEVLKAQLEPGSYRSVSSQDIGLPLGVRALAVDTQGAARRRSFPDRRRDGQARLPRLGHLGQGAGQIRGRHARDRQRHRVCQGTAADPAFRKGRFPGCDRREAGGH